MNAIPVQPEPEPRPGPEAPAVEADSPAPEADHPKRAAVTRNVDPEDWARSPGSTEEWLLRERPPHW
jgi:hypothetical protein